MSETPIIQSLETERLVLRALQQSDAVDLLILRSDPFVNQYLDRAPMASPDESSTFIAMINGDIEEGKLYYWAITMSPSDSLVGTICLWNFSDDGKKAEIGFEMQSTFQGQGLMTEALPEVLKFGFEHLKLSSIYAITHPENKFAKRLLNNYGFRNEGPVTSTPDSFLVFSNSGHIEYRDQ